MAVGVELTVTEGVAAPAGVVADVVMLDTLVAAAVAAADAAAADVAAADAAAADASAAEAAVAPVKVGSIGGIRGVVGREVVGAMDTTGDRWETKAEGGGGKGRNGGRCHVERRDEQSEGLIQSVFESKLGMLENRRLHVYSFTNAIVVAPSRRWLEQTLLRRTDGRRSSESRLHEHKALP